MNGGQSESDSKTRDKNLQDLLKNINTRYTVIIMKLLIILCDIVPLKSNAHCLSTKDRSHALTVGEIFAR